MAMVRMKSMFFDRTAVLDAGDRKRIRAMSRFGSFTRRTAKKSLRYGKGVSVPGQPPLVHRTQSRKPKKGKSSTAKQQKVSPLRELVFFAYDAKTQSVVIGPEIFRNAKRPGEAPEALEYGGEAIVNVKDGVATVIVIRPRPFMTPAFQKELPNAPSQWAENATGPLK